ncbi:hypothetical protein F4819DRAFT_94908 [Hypoxylon fuscum]|nr:hypothetical protein F4819DRAFT_94908 [Hypoxylon fuscum]
MRDDPSYATISCDSGAANGTYVCTYASVPLVMSSRHSIAKGARQGDGPRARALGLAPCRASAAFEIGFARNCCMVQVWAVENISCDGIRRTSRLVVYKDWAVRIWRLLSNGWFFLRHSQQLIYYLCNLTIEPFEFTIVFFSVLVIPYLT